MYVMYCRMLLSQMH